MGDRLGIPGAVNFPFWLRMSMVQSCILPFPCTTLYCDCIFILYTTLLGEPCKTWYPTPSCLLFQSVHTFSKQPPHHPAEQPHQSLSEQPQLSHFPNNRHSVPPSNRKTISPNNRYSVLPSNRSAGYPLHCFWNGIFL